MKKKLLLLIAVYLCVFSLKAQWSGNPLVGGAGVCTNAAQQTASQIIPDGSGGAIIFWMDSRNGNNIYYNKLNASGVAVWSSVSSGLSLTNDANYNYPDQVISDGSGGAFVCWETDNEALVQHINSSGAKTWGATGVSLSATGQTVSICGDGSGGIIATWADYKNDPINFNPQSYAQRVNSSGAKLWAADGVEVVNSSGLNASMGIVSDGAGGAIIAMIDTRNSNYDAVADEYDNIDIYAQRLNASGAAVWAAAGVPICAQASNQVWNGGGQDPYIIPDGSGGAVVAWEDCRNDPNNGHSDPSNEDIFCQRINAVGTVQWTANGVALCTQTDDQWKVTLMPDGTGGAVATWFDERSNYRIYAQKINGSGAVQWAANGITIASESNSFSYTASPDAANSSMLVTWVGNGGDIKAQKLNIATGAIMWGAPGTLVCSQADYQYEPAITHNGSSGALISWTDGRNSATSGSDIYANRVLADGTLPIQILSFDARVMPAYVTVRWSTATELNSREFYVQRSTDGSNFENITTTPAAGNSNTVRKYEYDDAEGRNLKVNQLFYRIMETDIDGQSYYTGVKNVKIPNGSNQLTLVYNPVRNDALLKYQSISNEKVRVVVIDHLGRVVLTTEQAVQPGINEIKLNTDNLTNGIYEIELSNSDSRYHVRMMKE